MNRIKELRESLGIQQKALAIDLGFAQPTISDWEAGKKMPSAKSTLKLADYFGVSVEYLLGRETEKPPAIERKRPEPQYKITPAEYRIILAYRKAVPADIQIIDNIVNRYVTETKEKIG